MKAPLLALGLGAALVGCKTEAPTPKTQAKPAPTAAAPASRPASAPPRAASQPAAASRPSTPGQPEVDQRVAAATQRLEASEAGRILLAAANVQGGLAHWYAGRALQFRYDYQPVKGTRRNSLQTIDLLSARAYHDLDHPAKGKLAFDGKDAWMKLEGDAKFAARFWALTPYYFVGMPFVLSDAGVELTVSDEDPKAAGFDDAHVIRATFEAGTGDAPDDYYVLYVDKKSHRLLALRYVVTYAPFFEGKATKSTPEKLLVFEDPAPAGPITLARRHVFYAFGDGKRGDKITVSDISEVKYGAAFDEDALKRPPGAVLAPL